MDEKKLKEAAEALIKDMETTAARMRELIISMPPHDLLGYIYAQHIMKAMATKNVSRKHRDACEPDDLINENQFLLEYVHAVLASDAAPAKVTFDEARCVELFATSRKLREQALFFAIASSADTKDGLFGPSTPDIEFRAKSAWVTLRGNRYQVLEGEFYHYVLMPHNDVLKEVYGVGAAEVADGFQAMANATRSGQVDAIEVLMKQIQTAQSFVATQRKPAKEAMKDWFDANQEQAKAAGRAMDNMFRGGITNVNRHTKLPSSLLADLAYQRGEDTDFFADGNFSGTPYRTLPARKKPLIQLGTDYYAVDPCFIRDAGYRALLYNLLHRKPDYKQVFEDRQKLMSEAAFSHILNAQLPGAKIFNEVYYKDPVNRNWSENDTLILIDDVLLLVEAKAGAAATIASPALDFRRHAQSVQDLVLKAHKQCERFFNYINSADEVPLYHLADGKYKECARIRRSDYRVMLPVGLTIESFSPFSTYCKDLPQVTSLLGKHAFISLSIDELLVLRRFLPSPGEFIHYMEVRQAVAEIRRAHLFDEFDHLGAYLKNNRFDQDIADQLKRGNMVVWDGMSDIVDGCFEDVDWESQLFPTQVFPDEVKKLLKALDATRAGRWLAVESNIRDQGSEGRVDLAKTLSDLRQTLSHRPVRYFIFDIQGTPLFFWLQPPDSDIDWRKVNDKASAAALAAKVSNANGVLIEVSANGIYHRALSFAVQIPKEKTEENKDIYEDAAQMAQSIQAPTRNQTKQTVIPITGRKPQRNEPCPCKSGKKYKRCHGR
jgi:hypothetical protein